MIKVMFQSRQGSDGGISSFQAFCTSLAARVGTGNMAGVAVALYLGGAVPVFQWLKCPSNTVLCPFGNSFELSQQIRIVGPNS